MKCISLNFAGALCLLCLAACQSEPAISGGESGGRAEASVSEERVEFTALAGPGQHVQAAE